MGNSTPAGTWCTPEVAKADWAYGACLNINFPDVPAERAGPLTVTRQGQGLMKALEDRRLTRGASLAATTMQIQLLDHLIMGAPAEGRAGYFSFRKSGLL